MVETIKRKTVLGYFSTFFLGNIFYGYLGEAVLMNFQTCASVVMENSLNNLVAGVLVENMMRIWHDLKHVKISVPESLDHLLQLRIQ